MCEPLDVLLRKIASVAGSVLVLASCATTGSGPTGTQPETSDRSSSRAEGDREGEGPDFVVETFEGDTLSLAEQRGTPVVLNFWESW